MSEPAVPIETRHDSPRSLYFSLVREMGRAQKPAARSAPAYSRFVNRRVGRYLAAAAHQAGFGANTVTAISAAWTFSAIAFLIIFPPSWALGITVALFLLIGYAFDSADGQVSRLQGTSSPAGEWLDHMVDSVKVVTMPLAVAIGFYRFDVVPRGWLLVPIAFSIVSAVLFFCMILTEQLRRAHGSASIVMDARGRPSWIRALLVLPMDYGVLCLSFVLLGAPGVFFTVYSLLFLATTVFLVLAAVKWFYELSAWPLATLPPHAANVFPATPTDRDNS